MTESQEPETFHVGELLILTDGEYSDYGVNAVVRVMREFTIDEARALPGVAVKNQWGGISTYITPLFTAGWLEDLTYRELHYGDLNAKRWTPA